MRADSQTLLVTSQPFAACVAADHHHVVDARGLARMGPDLAIASGSLLSERRNFERAVNCPMA
jgi:hypothetical protein